MGLLREQDYEERVPFINTRFETGLTSKRQDIDAGGAYEFSNEHIYGWNE
jgi:hypothetical protein